MYFSLQEVMMVLVACHRIITLPLSCNPPCYNNTMHDDRVRFTKYIELFVVVSVLQESNPLTVERSGKTKGQPLSCSSFYFILKQLIA